MKKINKKTMGLAVLSLLLVASIGVGSALAYFTTYTEAKGGVTLDLGFTDTEIDEKVEGGQKIVSIKNTGSEDCYVRFIAYVGDQYKISYLEKDGLSNWTPDADGYYYYNAIVPAGESTTPIYVDITFPGEAVAGTSFNVIIIQESTPVLYDAEGNPYADWDGEATISNKVTVDNDSSTNE